MTDRASKFESQLILDAATRVMNWHAERLADGYAIGEDGAPMPLFHIWDKRGSNGWNPLKSADDAHQLIERLNSAGCQVLVACSEKSTCVEVARWRDRRAEGIPGDPHTHRSRETFVHHDGEKRLRVITEACVQAARVLGWNRSTSAS